MDRDDEKWQKSNAGDESGLSTIYRQNFLPMFQYGIKFKDDPDFIKDRIQDVFCKLIQANTNLRSKFSIRYYLLKALKNSILKELDRSKKNISIEDVPMRFEAAFSLEEEIIEKEDKTRKDKAFLDGLKSLSHRQREIIYLRYECGLEYDQICKVMDLKNDSVRKLVFRAIKSLKKIVE